MGQICPAIGAVSRARNELQSRKCRGNERALASGSSERQMGYFRPTIVSRRLDFCIAPDERRIRSEDADPTGLNRFLQDGIFVCRMGHFLPDTGGLPMATKPGIAQIIKAKAWHDHPHQYHRYPGLQT